eukprot:g23473.t1
MCHNLWLFTLYLQNAFCPFRDILDPGTREAIHHPGVSFTSTEAPICTRNYRVPYNYCSSALCPSFLKNKASHGASSLANAAVIPDSGHPSICLHLGYHRNSITTVYDTFRHPHA